MFRGASGWKSDHLFGEKTASETSRFPESIFGDFADFDAEYHGIIMGFSDFDGKIPWLHW